MLILLFIYIFMGSITSIHLYNEMHWSIGDCLFAGIFWPVVIIWAYIQYINNG